MKIFIHAHYYLPRTLAGAEKFLHEIAKYLLLHGHEVIATVDEDTEFEHEGIKVVSNQRNIISYYQWADAVLTHLNHAGAAIQLGREFNKPVFHLLHNNDPYFELYGAPENNFIIYNSIALKEELKLPLHSIVAHPYIDPAYWANDIDHYSNEYITLVNCCYEKGGLFLQNLAKALPQYRFMGVSGGYNNQIIQLPPTRNIQFLPPQTDMRIVYDQTRIIIIPSIYESWGMVASEAMASGIPVICTNTPGLHENCGAAAIYAEQRVQPYREAIETFSEKKIYDQFAAIGRKRNKPDDLHKILKFMENNVKKEKEELVEKEEKELVKEKAEMEPQQEKANIERPGRIRTKTKQSEEHGQPGT